MKEWYTKHNRTVVDGLLVYVDERDDGFHFTCEKGQSLYRFVIKHGSHKSETEAKNVVSQWFSHVKNTFNTRYV